MKNKLVISSFAVLGLFMTNSVCAAGINYGNVSTGTITDLYTDDIIGTLNGNAKVVNMHGGSITTASSTAKADYTIEEMTGGTIGTVTYAKLKNISGGDITLIRNWSNVDSVSGTANIGTVEGGTKITNMTNGTINLVQGSNTGIEHIIGGRVETLTDSAFARLEGGTIGNLTNNGNIYWLTNGTIEIIDGGIIGGGSRGTIGRLIDGTIGAMDANVVFTSIEGGTITSLKGSFGNMSGGTLVTLNSSKSSGIISGGEITNAIGGGQIYSLEGSGYIGVLDGGSKVEYVKGGVLDTIQDTVFSRSGVGNLQDAGTINFLKDNSYIGALRNGGTLVNMQDTSEIYWMGGGTIVNMTGGTINAMAGGTIQNMIDGDVTSMTNGTIINMGADAVLSSIQNGTVTGTVASGAILNVANDGVVNLMATTSGTAFAGNVSTGIGAHVIVDNYDFASGAIISLANNSALHIGNATIDTASFASGGKIYVGSVSSSLSGTGYNAIINNLNASQAVNINFFVDAEIGSVNDLLTINGFTGTNRHTLSVANHNFGPDYHDRIDLINDETSGMQFKLTHGRYVGIGAKNYALRSEDNGSGGLMWALIQSDLLGLSDGAIVIGSMPTANIAILQSANNSIYSRMTDLRNQYTQGLWLRAIAQHTEFNSLTDVSISQYGVEGGFDAEIAHFLNGRLSAGVGFGYTVANVDVDTFETKDGGADSALISVNAYATYLLQFGLYFDATIGYSYVDSDAYFYDNADMKNKFDFTQNAFSTSLAVGYQIPVSRRFTLDPQIKMSYIKLQAADFQDAEGFDAEYDATTSLIGIASLTAKYKIAAYEPYLRMAYHHEFDGDTTIDYDNTVYKSELGGNRAEIAIGVTGEISPNTNLYAEGAFQTGDNDWMNYGGNIGVRVTF